LELTQSEDEHPPIKKMKLGTPLRPRKADEGRLRNERTSWSK
jgi:hypothetical protein